MAVLTKGRSELSCKDNVGGVKRLFLFGYVPYSYSQIVATPKGGELVTFPATDMYEFETHDARLTEDANKSDNGLSYTQTLTFTLKKQDYDTTNELTKMERFDFRYIVQLNSGQYKIGGLYKGAKLSFKTTTGGAKTDLNGYEVTIEGDEEYQAAFISDLDDFTIVRSFLYEDFINILYENNEQILLE